MMRRHAALGDRLAQIQRLLATEGPGGIAWRVRARVAGSLMPPEARRLEVSREDIIRAAEVAADGWRYPPPPPLLPGEPMRVAWVCTPPGPGSGGHTTMFRMVTALESAGHECIVYLRDQHGWSMRQHVSTIREHWPSVQADVRDLAGGIEDCHAIIATGWGSAYDVLGSKARGSRFYFVQDFEPMFSPAGSEYLLAEATYRFGFHGITAGPWLAEKLTRDYGMPADSFEFGCDLDTYRLDPSTLASPGRTGVAYYCRPGTPRRAHELAVFALDLFARRHPEVPIHFYGSVVDGLPFKTEQHGLLTPAELGRLYQRCLAGLVLSATNVSLVPSEMLAAGCTPVVNDAEHTRRVLGDARVRYAEPTPYDLADALSAIVSESPYQRVARAEAGAASVRSASWSAAGTAVERAIRHEVARQLLKTKTSA